MWSRIVEGATLSFHLAGINNQNFLMRDEQTGTYWQQISGNAVSGPLKGRHLTLVGSDELTFATWRAEEPQGTVLDDVAKYTSEYAPKDWDKRMQKQRTVIRHARAGIGQRDLMLGVVEAGASRAFPLTTVLKEKLINDRVGGQRIVLVVAPDGASVRAFRANSSEQDFYRVDEAPALMMDSATGSKWNFQGCAIEGAAKGSCLQRVNLQKDYWFDWRQYQPATTVFHQPGS